MYRSALDASEIATAELLSEKTYTAVASHGTNMRISMQELSYITHDLSFILIHQHQPWHPYYRYRDLTRGKRGKYLGSQMVTGLSAVQWLSLSFREFRCWGNTLDLWLVCAWLWCRKGKTIVDNSSRKSEKEARYLTIERHEERKRERERERERER